MKTNIQATLLQNVSKEYGCKGKTGLHLSLRKMNY